MGFIGLIIMGIITFVAFAIVVESNIQNPYTSGL